MSTPSTRRDDERLLLALHLRAAGHSVADITARLSFTRPEAVRIATNRVRAADLEESGEPSRVVLAAYGWVDTGGRPGKA